MDKVKLHYDDGVNWKWNCPKCNSGSFTYSKAINRNWGIPQDKVYCAICNTLHDFEKEDKNEDC